MKKKVLGFLNHSNSLFFLLQYLFLIHTFLRNSFSKIPWSSRLKIQSFAANFDTKISNFHNNEDILNPNFFYSFRAKSLLRMFKRSIFHFTIQDWFELIFDHRVTVFPGTSPVSLEYSVNKTDIGYWTLKGVC